MDVNQSLFAPNKSQSARLQSRQSDEEMALKRTESDLSALQSKQWLFSCQTLRVLTTSAHIQWFTICKQKHSSALNILPIHSLIDSLDIKTFLVIVKSDCHIWSQTCDHQWAMSTQTDQSRSQRREVLRKELLDMNVQRNKIESEIREWQSILASVRLPWAQSCYDFWCYGHIYFQWISRLWALIRLVFNQLISFLNLT